VGQSLTKRVSVCLSVCVSHWEMDVLPGIQVILT
jgi:hypothetical protein